MQTCVLIDGSNFYFKLKDIYFPLMKRIPEVDYSLLSKLLLRGDTPVELNYYAGKIKANPSDAKAVKMMAKQQQIVTEMQKNGWNINFGYLMKNNGHYSEKGVDVKMAVDIVSHACEKTCEKIVLLSSDTDLIPAIEKALQYGISVEYVGFSHQPSWGLMKTCKDRRLLSKVDLDTVLKNHTQVQSP